MGKIFSMQLRQCQIKTDTKASSAAKLKFQQRVVSAPQQSILETNASEFINASDRNPVSRVMQARKRCDCELCRKFYLHLQRMVNISTHTQVMSNTKSLLIYIIIILKQLHFHILVYNVFVFISSIRKPFCKISKVR